MASTCKYRCANGKVFLEALGKMVDCPECRNITKVLEKPDNSGVSLYEKLRIPQQYKNFGVAGREIFNAPNINVFTENSINHVANLLERINRDLYSGKVPSISCYIYTSTWVDIKRFVYGAQKLALEKGLGVTPYISCNTLYGLQKVGEFNIKSLQEFEAREDYNEIPPDILYAIDGYRLVQHTKLTYFDFIHADLCFIEATANTSERGWSGLADLLGERAKQGLPTYVIGYWPSSRVGMHNGSRGLRYLLAPEYGFVRLDMLVPFELKPKKAKGEEVSLNRVLDVESTSSGVLAGLSIERIMS